MPGNTVQPFEAEGVRARALRGGAAPERIVVLRFAPFGDVVATLPVLSGLRERFPRARIELVTSEPFAPLFDAVVLVDRVWTRALTGSRSRAAFDAARLAFRIGTPDVVVDLQRSEPSGVLRTLLRPRAWAAFDRYAPAHALERYLAACHAAGLGDVRPGYRSDLQPEAEERGRDILRTAGIAFEGGEPARPLVCLNPAGCWPTKNWPVDRYIALGERLTAEWDARVVLMGTHNVRQAAQEIAAALGPRAVNLVDRTTVAEALAIVRRLTLMVSDDSALMHLAWSQDVPTVGIFGSSRAAWSRPYGPHSSHFGSEDLSCGACMRPTCARGDLLCLHRVQVEAVLAAAKNHVTTQS